MLIAALLNAALNPLFIYGLGLGIKGSAWATVLSQAVAAVWVLAHFLRGVGTLRLRKKCLTIQGEVVAEIVKIGMAPFLLQLGNSLVLVVLNYNLIEYGGVLAVAAFGIINRVFSLILMPLVGISQGAQPIIGYNYGAGQYSRVIETVKLASLAATGVCLLGFNGNPELIETGAAGLKLFLFMLPVVGLQIIGANYFQAVGKAGYAIIFNLLRQIIFLIPMVYILPKFLGLAGIWLAGPISDFGAALLTGIFIFQEMKQLSNKAFTLT